MKTFVLYNSSDLNKDGITGGTRRVQEIIEFLIKKGNKVHFYAPKNVDVYKNENLILHPIKTIRSKIFPDGLLTFIYNFNELKAIKNIKYDTFIVISTPFGIQATLLKLKRISFMIREDFIGYRAIRFDKDYKNSFLKIIKGLYLKVLIYVERYVLKNVNKIIVQCDYDKQITLNRHKNFKKQLDHKFIKLFNNVNPSWIEKYKGDIRKEAIVKKPEDYYNFHFIGNINDTRKGVQLLLKAGKKIIDKGYKIKINIIGGGSLLGKYKKEYKEYSNIKFFGHLPNPMNELKNSDLLVVPSLADSFPNTVMEALYIEIPVIGSKRGGIPEMLEYDELLFKANVESLYELLLNIIDNSLIEKLRQLCIKRKQKFTFEWVEKIQELL